MTEGDIFDGNGFKIRLNHIVGYNYDTGQFDVLHTDTTTTKPNAVLWPGNGASSQGEVHSIKMVFFRLTEYSHIVPLNKNKLLLKI